MSWCMLFTYNIILIEETCGGVSNMLEVWRHTLESKGFMLSRTNTEYLDYKFSGVTHEAGLEVRFDTQ